MHNFCGKAFVRYGFVLITMRRRALHNSRQRLLFFFCNTSPKSLLESPQEASPSYRVSPTSQVTVSGWGSREEKGAVDSGFAFVQNN